MISKRYCHFQYNVVTSCVRKEKHANRVTPVQTPGLIRFTGFDGTIIRLQYDSGSLSNVYGRQNLFCQVHTRGLVHEYEKGKHTGKAVFRSLSRRKTQNSPAHVLLHDLLPHIILPDRAVEPAALHSNSYCRR